MIINVALFLGFWLVSVVPMKRALHMFQQNRYELFRYQKWLFRKKNFSGRFYLFSVGCFLLLCLGEKNRKLFLFLLPLTIYYFWQEEKKREREYIKKLVYTARVKRQILYFSVLQALCLAVSLHLNAALAYWGACFFPSLLIFPMALLTAPLEKAVKKYYEKDAQRILQNHTKLLKIGITGSFGKTSVKNIAFDLLSEHFYVLKTPASYNTPMGITRTIREELKPLHEVFLCEMGADHVGEITYLMNFVTPQYGVVTSIGPQHLNTFGSIENIIHEKMQMIECLPANGVGIVNIDNPYIANYAWQGPQKMITVGIHNAQADYFGQQLSYDQNGSHFMIEKDGKRYFYQIPLLGENNVVNCLLAIALAVELGVTMEETVRYSKTIRPIEHRLEKKVINGFHFIDNAFNSNPVSCKQSLDVLSLMPGKRVIITPGLIDLGKEEYAANKEFGAYMKGKADFVIIVGELEKEAILAGLKESGYPEKDILCVATEKEAFAEVYCRFTPQDSILLENDLPDAFLK